MILRGARESAVQMSRELLRGSARIDVVETSPFGNPDVVLAVFCGALGDHLDDLVRCKRQRPDLPVVVMPPGATDAELAGVVAAQTERHIRVAGRAARPPRLTPPRRSRERRRAHRVELTGTAQGSVVWQVAGVTLRLRIADFSVPIGEAPGGMKALLEPSLVGRLPPDITQADAVLSMRLELGTNLRAIPIRGRLVRLATRAATGSPEPIVFGIEYAPVFREDVTALDQFRMSALRSWGDRQGI